VLAADGREIARIGFQNVPHDPIHVAAPSSWPLPQRRRCVLLDRAIERGPAGTMDGGKAIELGGSEGTVVGGHLLRRGPEIGGGVPGDALHYLQLRWAGW
jgi:hypothetical protein